LTSCILTEVVVLEAGLENAAYFSYPCFDGVEFVAGSEEIASSSSACPGCEDANGNDTTILGCCIVHFWGWDSGTGACSSCC